jgi:hypothetical protein
MKHTIRLFGIIAFVAVMGFCFIACDDGSGGGDNDGNNNKGNGDGTPEEQWGEWEETIAPTLITEGEEKRTSKDDPSRTETRVKAILITTTDLWNQAVSQISERGNAGTYTLTIGGDVGVAGSTDLTFGTTASGSSLSVALKGSDKLYLTSQGNLIYIDARQTLIIDSEDLTLQGLTDGENGATQDNNRSMVYVVANGTLELKRGTISGNTTTGYGGGVYMYGTGSSFTMHGGAISGNASSYSGGGGGVCVSTGGTFTMHGGVISDNTATPSTTGSSNSNGGGVYVLGTGSSFTMHGGAISDNTGIAGLGGGVHVGSGTTFTMHGGEITGNSTTSVSGKGGVSGAGVHVRGTFTMHGGEISGNTVAAGGSGSGVYVYTSGTFMMYNGKISGNSGDSGVRMYNGGTFTMRGGEISGNGNNQGAGVRVNGTGSSFTMDGGKIFGNTTINYGGGVYIDGGTFTMKNGEIFGNTANNQGGGVYRDSGTFRIVTGTIYGSNEPDTNLRNTARSQWAALYGTGSRGTLDESDEWTSLGTLYSTESTIRIRDGLVVTE